MWKRTIVILALTVWVPFSMSNGRAGFPKGETYTAVPHSVDPTKKYLFYMHGSWIEMNGLNQTHPLHGLYEYDRVVNAFLERGIVVISEARLIRVPIGRYANNVAGQVRLLLNRGLSPGHITVIGHSKGGHMALLVASIMEEDDVNFVVMARCGKKGTQFRRGYETFLKKRASSLRGRILTIYDTDDRVSGICREAFEMAPRSTTQKIVLHTRKGHGLFYSPESIWIDHVVRWAER